MKKKEFLGRLYDVLCESIDKSEAMLHINYYEDYINSEIKKGRKEEEIVEELGNPRLIAKSILSAGSSAYKYSNVVDDKNNAQENAKSDIKMKLNGKNVNSMKGKFTLWAIFALVILTIAIVVGSVMGIVILIGKIIMKFIVPIAIVIGAIMIINIIKK